MKGHGSFLHHIQIGGPEDALLGLELPDHLVPNGLVAFNEERLELQGASLGGGRVRIQAIDGLETSFSGDMPTLIIRNEDRPGQVHACWAS